MKNYLFISERMIVREMGVQEMLNMAYEIAEAEGSCHVYDYDDDERDWLVNAYKAEDGRVVTIYDPEF